jgi:thioredoxin 1
MKVSQPVNFLAIAVMASLLHTTAAFALEQRAFDAAAFSAAQQAGKPVVVHVTAPWCPTCVAQHAAIDSLAAKPEFSSVTLFKIDFDSQPETWKGFGVRSQSTLVAFSGKQETGRLVGETKAGPIGDLFKGAIAK